MRLLRKLDVNIEQLLTRKTTLLGAVFLIGLVTITHLYQNIYNNSGLLLITIIAYFFWLVFYSWSNKDNLFIFSAWFLLVSIGISMGAFIISIIIYAFFKDNISFKSIILVYDLITFIILLLVMYRSDKNNEGYKEYFNYSLFATGAIYIIVGYYLPIYAKFGDFDGNPNSVVGLMKLLADSDEWKMDKGVLLEHYVKIASYPLLAVNGALKTILEYRKVNRKDTVSDNKSLFMYALMINFKKVFGKLNVFKIKKCFLIAILIPVMVILMNPSYNQHYKVINSDFFKGNADILNRKDLTPYEKKTMIQMEVIDSFVNSFFTLDYNDYYFFSLTKDKKNNQLLTVGYLNNVYTYEEFSNSGITNIAYILIATEAVLLAASMINLIRQSGSPSRVTINFLKVLFLLVIFSTYYHTNPLLSPIVRFLGSIAVTCFCWTIFAIISPTLASFSVSSSRIKVGAFFLILAMACSLVGATIKKILN